MNHLLKSPTETVDASGVVVKAVDHVIDFNLKGLQRIENDLFFPWLRDQLSNANDISSDVKQSFSNVIDVIDDERRQMEELAEHMVCGLYHSISFASFESLSHVVMPFIRELKKATS
jgi:hypothetical protein